MDLGPDMMCDQPDDPLGLCRSEPLTRIGHAAGQPIDPDLAIGVEHDLGDVGVGEPSTDCGSERTAEHRGAALVDEDRGLGHFRLRAGRTGDGDR